MFLGIDTSCYTSSLALLSKEGEMVDEKRKILNVKTGECGLRQSEMVFQHTKNLPILFEELFSNNSNQLLAICASVKPRPLENSYMPTFIVGTSFARSVTAVEKTNLYLTSHQENHIQAGLWSAGGPKAGCFIALHASGGTTDLLLVEKGEIGLTVKEIGTSIDLHAGQFVDRVGVELGLPFPCGRQLEYLALTASEPASIPVAVDGLRVSFSGPLTATKKLIKQQVKKENIAAGVQIALAKSFVKLLKNACKWADSEEVLLVGGVSSNIFIRNFLIEKLGNENIKAFFPQPQFCSDNAVGCAVEALHRWRQGVG